MAEMTGVRGNGENLAQNRCVSRDSNEIKGVFDENRQGQQSTIILSLPPATSYTCHYDFQRQLNLDIFTFYCNF